MELQKLDSLRNFKETFFFFSIPSQALASITFLSTAKSTEESFKILWLPPSASSKAFEDQKWQRIMSNST